MYINSFLHRFCGLKYKAKEVHLGKQGFILMLFGSSRGKRDDIELEDDQESYFRYMEENPTAGLINEDDDIIDYDEEGNPIMPDRKVSQRT